MSEKLITKFLLFTMFPLGVAMILDRLISQTECSGRMPRHWGIYSDFFVFSIEFC